MKLRILLTLAMVGLFLGAIGPTIAEHNDEFPTNGCDSADHSINVTANGQVLEFVIDGEKNPEIKVGSGSCVEVTFDNTSELDHDFTVVDDTVDEEDDFYELIHMDTNAGNETHHLWQMPEKDVSLNYFCEVAGHRDGGMEGTFIIGEGSDSGFLPGFELYTAFAGLLLLIAIPTLRRKFN
jgi:uncharacterized cupredoxin-like copper-binding protein